MLVVSTILVLDCRVLADTVNLYTLCITSNSIQYMVYEDRGFGDDSAPLPSYQAFSNKTNFPSTTDFYHMECMQRFTKSTLYSRLSLIQHNFQ